MEVLVCGIMTSIWWIASGTVLLPFLFLLTHSKSFSNWWFSYIFRNACRLYFEPKMSPNRKKAFELLKEKISQKGITKPLKVLEIGIGSGANFEFYPENVHLTALDMNVNFEASLKKNRNKYTNITYERMVIAGAENMKAIDNCSMDVVISTYVLCSVTSLDDVMKEVQRVLKPDGHFLFLEHVSYPKSTWSSKIQKFADPLWSVYFGGCCLTRETGEVIKKAGFSHVICEKIFPKIIPLFLRPQIYGLAAK